MGRHILSVNIATIYNGSTVARPGLGNINFKNRGDAWLYCWKKYGLGNFIVLQ